MNATRIYFNCLIVLLLFSSCFESKKTTTSDERNDYSEHHSKQWYSGGTLHKSKVYEWKKSTKENKLATCADFMATVNNKISMEELKIKSTNLMNCIDEATLDETSDSEKISTIAALCITILNYN